jgi:hypothetical protein
LSARKLLRANGQHHDVRRYIACGSGGWSCWSCGGGRRRSGFGSDTGRGGRLLGINGNDSYGGKAENRKYTGEYREFHDGYFIVARRD